MADADLRLGETVTQLDRATTFLERPLRRGTLERFNPLPHAGTISTFLLVVVVVSGAYLTLFFSFGYAASYDSVAGMEDHVIQRVVRALHRYASAMLVLTTIVHGWRIFVGQRFSGRVRRWRWATGVTALALVWLAGVTGYWLVWDRRAGAISEAVAATIRPLPGGEALAVRHLLGHSLGTGGGTLFAIWVAHLGLSAVLGWAVFRHVRGTKLRSFPPREWMLILGGCLAVVSIALPVGMLGPARPDELVADMPLDPFVLFLLPPLLGSFRWPVIGLALVVLAIVTVLPWLLRRSDRAVPNVDPDRCTGCELCVIDCPYNAVAMVAGGDRGLALIDPAACVACGICIGSCAFDAIAFPGEAAPMIDVSGRSVAVVCERQRQRSSSDADVVVGTTCAGMLAPSTVRDFHDRGALHVELVGCPPGDCRYGVGSQLASDRLRGARSPHPPRALSTFVDTSIVTEDAEPQRKRLAAAVAVVSASVAIVVAATSTPFTTDTVDGALRVLVDHRAGAPLLETGAPADTLSPVEVVVDGLPLGVVDFGSDSTEVGWADWSVPVGRHRVTVRGSDAVLFDDEVTIASAMRMVVSATDAPPAPGADQGESVFSSRGAGCNVCHSVEVGEDGIGPSLAGVASLAGDRVPGLDAENYLRQSILLPDQYVVDGWEPGQMLPIYRDRLSAEELESLIEYLLTLEEQP